MGLTATAAAAAALLCGQLLIIGVGGQACIGPVCPPGSPFTKDPNYRDFNLRGKFGDVLEGGIGTSEYPADSCTDLRRNPHFNSDYYWLQPWYQAEGLPMFQGFCDMESFGGGWLMCYTTDGEVSVSTEFNSGPAVPYSQIGYRADCRDYPFNQVMYIVEPAQQPDGTFLPDETQKAWFSFNGRSTLSMVKSGFGGSINESWAGGENLKWSAHGSANTRTPECVQQRINAECVHPPIAAGKVQQCVDCFSVRPQRGNATCAGDASLCWPPNVPNTNMRIDARHDAALGYYVGWSVKITEGTGTGQIRQVGSSTGGYCSSASFATKTSCIDSENTWTDGTNEIGIFTPWDVVPCSDPANDGYICTASCSMTHPEDETTCGDHVVFDTEANCLAGCKSYDHYKKSYSIDYTGADGGGDTLAAAITTPTEIEISVNDANGQGIVHGKAILIGSEVMYVLSVVGNTLRVTRGYNETTAATHALGDPVTVLVDYSVYGHSLPSCAFSCTTKYELYSPNECTAVDWECGYERRSETDPGGQYRGYVAEVLDSTLCTADCMCDNAGTPTCGTGNVAGCGCRGSIDWAGRSQAGPWSDIALRLPEGVNLNYCVGPFFQCEGENPYKDYRIRIGQETRMIVGYSGIFKTVYLDAPFTTPPVPAPFSDPTWVGATNFEMILAEQCTGTYRSDLEASECAKDQEYELLICDKGEGGMGGGLMMTGHLVHEDGSECVKTCEDTNFCGDVRTEWYRADTGVLGLTGVAFKENGFRRLPRKKISVGIRYVNNEGY